MDPASTRALVAYGREHTDETRQLLDSIRTGEDLFHAALLWNAFDRHTVTPLPGIRMPDVVAPWSDQPTEWRSPTPAPVGARNFWEGYGPEGLQRPQFGTNTNFRYLITKGLLQRDLKITLAAGETREIWIGMDHLSTTAPVMGLDATDLNNIKSLTQLELPLGWTNNPYILPISMAEPGPPTPAVGGDGRAAVSGRNNQQAKDYDVVPGSDRPRGVGYSTDIGDAKKEKSFGAVPVIGNAVFFTDSQNLYWPGSSQLDVQWVNPNAYNSAAFRVRTNTNMNKRVFNGLTYLTNPNGVDEPLFKVPFKAGRGARAGYSGDSWQSLRGFNFPDAGALDYVSYVQTDRVMRQGMPFIQLSVNNVGTGGSTLQFSVTAECWVGTTSLNPSIIGTLPYQTIPYQLPAWFAACKSSGEIDQGDSPTGVSMGLNSVRSMAEQMGSQTPMTQHMARSLGSNQIVKNLQSTASIINTPDNHSVVKGLVKDAMFAGAGAALTGHLPQGITRIPGAARKALSSATKPSFWRNLLNGAETVGGEVLEGTEAAGGFLAANPEMLLIGA